MSQPKMKIIAICTPTLGVVGIEWASTLRAIAWPLNTGYANFFTLDDVGGAIAETRNACVHYAMRFENDQREITHLFWLDDDVICNRMALLKLLSHNVDIASGVYFTKCDPSEPLIFPGRVSGTTPFVPDQVFETWGHGMGLTLVKMDVYKKMLAAGLPKDSQGRPEWYKTKGAEHAAMLDGMADMGGTEDLFFLDAAAKLGYRPIVDTSQQAFGWHWCEKTKTGYPLKQWQQRKRGEPIVWDTPNGPMTWGQVHRSSQEATKTVLHVGCGPKPSTLPERFNGWKELRVDVDPKAEPDLVASMAQMPAVQSDSVDAVYSSHSLEHLHAHEVPLALAEFRRVLKPGGFVLLTTPDLQQAAARIANGQPEEAMYHSPAGPIAPLDICFGHRHSIALGNGHMAHKTGFTVSTLRAQLAACFSSAKVESVGLDLWAEAIKG